MVFKSPFFLAEELVLAIKIIVVGFCFIWVRAAFPRYRYDQLMTLGWKVFLPFSLGWIFLLIGILFFFQFFLI
jgi:NADH-quinone oxidoreductase subunit H